VSHIALQGKVKSLWAEKSKGTHNLYVTTILYGSTVNDTVAQTFLIKGHFWLYFGWAKAAMYDQLSYLCVQEEQKKNFWEKLKISSG
jgi:hypothetical protein